MLSAASRALLRSLLSMNFRNSITVPAVQYPPSEKAGHHRASLDIMIAYDRGVFRPTNHVSILRLGSSAPYGQLAGLKLGLNINALYRVVCQKLL